MYYAYLCCKMITHIFKIMKTEIQIQHFLNSQMFKSEADWEVIDIFAKRQKYSLQISPKYSDDGVDIATFTTWFNSGFASGDVAVLDGSFIILGHCTLTDAKIEATWNGVIFDFTRLSTTLTKITKASDDDAANVLKKLSEEDRQFDRRVQLITQKYIPSINERVEFYNDEIRGLGVVREIRPNDNYIEFYCYYIYNTGEIGYSMHETGVCTVHEFNFMAMTISSQRRMNRELERFGKIWYDKLHRIEPLKVKVAKGQKYYYINDKMKMVTETEKDTPTSQMRYIAGNYFASVDECTTYLGKFAELLRDRLALPEEM